MTHLPSKGPSVGHRLIGIDGSIRYERGSKEWVPYTPDSGTPLSGREHGVEWAQTLPAKA